jgi:toxin ParE1/3/4
MKKSFVLTPRAEQDIRDIWDYIAMDSIHAADRVLTAVEEAMFRLAKAPGVGHLREDLADRRHQLLLVYSYLSVHLFETKPLQVIRALNASRDVQSILGLPAEDYSAFTIAVDHRSLTRAARNRATTVREWTTKSPKML